MTTNIAIFASGNGSNAENIVKYFENHPNINVTLIVSNNATAYVLERAKKLGVEYVVFSKGDFYKHPEKIIATLKKHNVNFIVLAGFMLKIHPEIIKAFPNKIINIHPALLPKFGGKGMYGDHVHKAVKTAGETESGITIHYVNEFYDEGEIIAQFKTTLAPSDTYKEIAEKVHALEYKHYPEIIEKLLNA